MLGSHVKALRLASLTAPVRSGLRYQTTTPAAMPAIPKYERKSLLTSRQAIVQRAQQDQENDRILRGTSREALDSSRPGKMTVPKHAWKEVPDLSPQGGRQARSAPPKFAKPSPPTKGQGLAQNKAKEAMASQSIRDIPQGVLKQMDEYSRGKTSPKPNPVRQANASVKDSAKSWKGKKNPMTGNLKEMDNKSQVSPSKKRGDDVVAAADRHQAEGQTETEDAGNAEGADEIPADGIDGSRSLPPHMQSVASMPSVKGSIEAKDVNINEVKPAREMVVNRLRRELQRIPFNPGVHFMQDPRTGVWNFSPESLHNIPTPEEFAYHRMPQYISPGKDTELSQLAKTEGVSYIGSTSTLTKAFSQIYFALSGNRPVDLNYLSQAFSAERSDFTFGATLPGAIVVGKRKDGVCYIDSDKQYDVDNVLSRYGNILEKMLTTEPKDFERFLKRSPESAVPESERTEREAYMYQRAAKILMRSQLDCYDPRLPGTGVFDIKTRACLPIRHDRANREANAQYDIFKDRGYALSYEREYYDLIRAALLKFSMQVRIGMMDGIFLAYHNTDRIFGFQYLPLTQIDEHLFGSSELGDQAFKLTTTLFERLMDEITGAFPDEDVQVMIKQVNPRSIKKSVTAFVEPRHWPGSAETRPVQAFEMEIVSSLNGEKHEGPMKFSVDEAQRKKDQWSVEYTITPTAMDSKAQMATRSSLIRVRSDLVNMMWVSVPDGKTPDEMNKQPGIQYGDFDDDLSVTKWKYPTANVLQMRQEAQQAGAEYEKRKASWPQGPPVHSWEPTT